MKIDFNRIIFLIGILMFCGGAIMQGFHVGDGSYLTWAGVFVGAIAIFIK
jgi:hypothetical protein